MVAYVVDLEGGMGDVVLAGEEFFEFAPAGVAVFLAADEDVGGEGREARGDGPDVEIVDLHYAFGRCHPPSDLFGVQAAWCGLEQDVGRVSEELPGTTHDQEPDGDADQWVGISPAGEDDSGGGDHRADRTEGVGEHVAHGPLHVQALAPRPVEDGSAHHVDEEPECGHGQHRSAEHLRRFYEARVGLDEDPDRDRHQRHPVREGGQDLGPTVAEALLRCRRSPCQPGGEKGDPEREVIREHVSRVGEQGEAPREEAADDLHHREARGQDEHYGQRAAVPVTRVRRAVVFVMAHGAILSPRGCHGRFADGSYRPWYWRFASQMPKATCAVPRRRISLGFSAKKWATLRTPAGRHAVHGGSPPYCDVSPSVTSSFLFSALRKTVSVTVSPGLWSRRAPRRSP